MVENYPQHTIVTYDGKAYEKEHTHTHTQLNHFAAHLKLTQHF